MSKNSVKALQLASVAATSFTGSYQLLTTLAQSCFLIRMVNSSDQNILISYDGATDNDILPVGANPTELQLNFQTNAQPNGMMANLAKASKIYIKAPTGMTGSVYVTGYYLPVGG